MKLPVKLLGLVAKHLSPWTCAERVSLNVTKKAIRAETLPVRYQAMVSWAADLYKKVGSALGHGSGCAG